MRERVTFYIGLLYDNVDDDDDDGDDDEQQWQTRQESERARSLHFNSLYIYTCMYARSFNIRLSCEGKAQSMFHRRKIEEIN